MKCALPSFILYVRCCLHVFKNVLEFFKNKYIFLTLIILKLKNYNNISLQEEGAI